MKVIKHKDKWYLQSETGYKEILLSTDDLLIQDGVQAIDDEFLKWFVKNPSCEEVEVLDLYGKNLTLNKGDTYKIIIPKEESITCPKCRTNDFKNCHSISCPIRKEESKQETLEESTDKSLQDEIDYWYRETGSLTSETIIKRAYSLGATKQAERMYSEVELKHIINKLNCDFKENPKQNITKWFEQFKKSRIVK